MSGAGGGGTAVKAKRSDKDKEAAGFTMALEQGVKIELGKLESELLRQEATIALVKKAQNAARLMLTGLLHDSPALGTTPGDKPATVARLRGELRQAHKDVVTLSWCAAQAAEARAAVKDFKETAAGAELLPPGGRAVGEQLRKRTRRIAPDAKSVTQEVAKLKFFDALQRAMGERKAGEEDVVVEETQDLKHRVKCSLSMDVMKVPVKKCVGRGACVWGGAGGDSTTWCAAPLSLPPLPTFSTLCPLLPRNTPTPHRASAAPSAATPLRRAP
jgi:hypothetical protein